MALMFELCWKSLGNGEFRLVLQFASFLPGRSTMKKLVKERTPSFREGPASM